MERCDVSLKARGQWTVSSDEFRYSQSGSVVHSNGFLGVDGIVPCWIIFVVNEWLKWVNRSNGAGRRGVRGEGR